jgi:tetratricopeptide (TPR) repeat protein
MAVAVSGGFIGRGKELARLLAALERAEQGQPGLVLVAGDAGVGKSRLLTELAAQARQRGAQALAGGCLEVGDVGLPYVPIITALRSVAAVDREQLFSPAARGLPGLGRLLPELTEEAATTSLGGHLDQLQLFDAVRSLLVRLSERAAVVLVLEDLHWADPSTRELISFLHRTLFTGPLLIVGSYRSDELHRRHPLRPWLAESFRQHDVERIELAPFTRAELAEYLAVGRREPLSAAVVDRILVRSEGNPFYAEELLAAGADQATVVLPSGLAEVLLSRIEVLSDAAQQVLRVAAVAGRQVGHELLARAAGLPEPELERALREAIGARVLVADAEHGTYGFRHALIQEALYGELLPSERVRLHADFARLLAAAGEAWRGNGMAGRAAELAHHCLASHDLAGALAASVRAAAEAEAVVAPAETLRHLEQALALWEQVPEAATVTGADRIDLLLRAAAAGSDAGSRERAIALTREAVERIDAAAKPLQAAAAFERLGHYLIDMHRQAFGEALQACSRAVELVPADPPTRLRARVSSTFAEVLKDAGRYGEARHWCGETLRVARVVGRADEEAEALTVLAMLEEREGCLDTALDLYTEARRRAADARNARAGLTVVFHRAYSMQLRGDLGEALKVLNEGIDLARRAGLAWSQPGVMLRGWQCRVHYMLGNWDESERLATTFDVVVATPAQARLSVLALPVEVGRGHSRAAERLKWIRMLGEDLSVLVGVAAYGAELACWEGDLDAARASIQGALRAYRSVGSHATVPMIMLCPFGLAADGAQHRPVPSPSLRPTPSISRPRWVGPAAGNGPDGVRRRSRYRRGTAAVLCGRLKRGDPATPVDDGSGVASRTPKPSSSRSRAHAVAIDSPWPAHRGAGHPSHPSPRDLTRRRG